MLKLQWNNCIMIALSNEWDLQCTPLNGCPLKSRLCLLPLAEVIDIHPWICAVLSFCKVTELLIADPI